jgi:hypothetical protein
MRAGRPAIVGQASIENLTERLGRHDISRPRAETPGPGTGVMLYYLGLKALAIEVLARCLKPAPALHL